MSEAKAAKRPAGLGCVLVLVCPNPQAPGSFPRSVCPHLDTVLLYLPTFLPGPSCTYLNTYLIRSYLHKAT